MSGRSKPYIDLITMNTPNATQTTSPVHNSQLLSEALRKRDRARYTDIEFNLSADIEAIMSRFVGRAGESEAEAKQREADSYKLGIACIFGYGTDEDVAAAIEWYRARAEDGDAAAQRELGTAYLYMLVHKTPQFAQKNSSR